MSREIILLVLVAILSTAGLIILLAAFVYSLLSPTKVKERLDRFVEMSQDDEIETEQIVVRRRVRISGVRKWMNDFLSIFASKSIHLKLQSSNWQITVIEFILIQLSSGILSLILIGLISGNLLIGIFGGVVIYLLPGFFLQQSIYKRQRKFQDQLVDVLVLLKGAVQAGFSLLQSLDVVIKEMPEPAGEEFFRVKREVQFGIPLGQSLENLSERMESDDLRMVVTAIIINNQVGGSLSLMLNAVTETIRNRIALMGEVRALTSYARYASYFLTLLPVITALIVMLLSPDYFSGVLYNPITIILFVAALAGIVLGNIWLRRLAQIRV